MKYYKFDISKLQKGDIILIRDNSELSKRIREKSQSNYSHAMLYVGTSSVIEAGEIVEANNIQRRLLENIDDAIVLRLIDSLFEENVVSKAVEFARSKIATQYSLKEAQRVISEKTKAKEPNRQICTRLIAKSYEYAGLQIVENPDYCTTNEILNSTYLKNIDNVIVEANDSDVNLAADPENVLKDQSEITKEMYEAIRQYTKEDIQEEGQMVQYVLSHQAKAKHILDIMRESGYFELWKLEKEYRPYHYDVSKFCEKYANNVPQAAYEICQAIAELLKTYQRQYCTYTSLYILHRKNVLFREMVKLYKNLIEMCKEMEMVATTALRTYINKD